MEMIEQNNNLIPCPCCGFCTLPQRATYDICLICWWEDDGQDNADADEVLGGPNYEMSLTQGRINFLKFGLYDPNRKDLMKLKKDQSNFRQGRFFILDGDGVKEIFKPD